MQVSREDMVAEGRIRHCIGIDFPCGRAGSPFGRCITIVGRSVLKDGENCIIYQDRAKVYGKEDLVILYVHAK